MAEAQKFILENNYSHALLVYNQALAIATQTQAKALLPHIEDVLSKASSQVIQEFSRISNSLIEKELLQYYLGLKLALENQNVQAKQVLESFVNAYPHHRYYPEALDLLGLVRKSLFNKKAIGCLLPLSGKYAIFGQSALEGIQLAVKDMSERYNTDLQVFIQDSQADPAHAEEGVRQLYQKNVAAIIGPLLPVTQAGLQAETLEIPMIALTQKDDFPSQGDFLFSNFITPQMQVQTLGAYLFGQLGLKKVAILYPDEPYGRTYMNLFWDMVNTYGAEIVGVEAYDGKSTDFTEPIQKLTGEFFDLPEFLKPPVLEDREAETLVTNAQALAPLSQDKNPRNQEVPDHKVEIDFQALFIPDSPSKLKLILPQLAFNDVSNIYLAGTNLWHHDALLEKTVRKYTRHAVIADGYFDQSQNIPTQEFSFKFKTLFNQTPKFLEAIAYDTACFVFSTAMEKEISTHQQLRSALQGGRVYEGATGITVFDSQGNAHRQLFLITMENGRFIEITR